ncbi:calcium-binding protein [Aestuariicoccus sp. MJ-SS9]|uniref:calcium-binding protein n=1 Tax=Aestuariicoccus sp. MJ-SS9 TaxID=3079855 RepID=UPI00290CBCA7|nr:calcium-binding protein [Aestuariicoccus sp. MJ-SS9]MDU8912518.1 calcium-binding protein [Aestuariicoccus sp. MJ-SS9]
MTIEYSTHISVENEGSIAGPGVERYVGQTFEALPGYAQELTVQLGFHPVNPWEFLPVNMRLLIVEQSQLEDGSYGTEVLFESVTFQSPSTQTLILQDFSFALGDLEFVPGETYAFVLDAFVEVESNNNVGAATVGVASILGEDRYADGNMFSINLGPFPTGTREDHFSEGLSSYLQEQDLSFFMGFSDSAGTGLIGTDEADRIFGGKSSAAIDALGGDDFVRAGAGYDTVIGGNGHDTIMGGAGDDNIGAGAGSDFVLGGDGNDSLGGGPGDDTVDGDAGDDVIGGGSGNDTLRGGEGNDLVNAGPGNDLLSDYEGSDTMGGSFGRDRILGGTGNDSLGGGSGKDVIWGETGDDSLGGGAGDDTIAGSSGDDFLAGGGRNDSIEGGPGNDTINGGDGDDTMTGGSGSDVFVFNFFKDGDEDVITNFKVGTDSFRMVGVENAPGSGLQGKVDALNITDTAGGALFDYQGHTVLIEGVAAADLTVEDFTFL